jgi:tetratricopeptide (TPR) repeat protein
MLRAITRLTLAILGLTASVCGIAIAARANHGRSLAELGRKSKDTSSLERAIRLAPLDPETHSAYAFVLADGGHLDEAIRECETALALRPADYLSWLVLGELRQRTIGRNGALDAFQSAERLAPHYANPHWYSGYVLMLDSRRREAAVELASAVQSDPSVLPATLDLLWWGYDGDAQALLEDFRPVSSSSTLSLARFLIGKGKLAETVNMAKDSKALNDGDRNALVAELIHDKAFNEAYRIWSRSEESGAGILRDGSFEKFNGDGSAFNWLTTRASAKAIPRIDPDQPHGGSYSLRLEFVGSSEPSEPIVSQLVLVEPKKHYRLDFVARTKGLVTGGPVVITVFDANRDGGVTLGQSEPLPPNATMWRDYVVDFTTTETTRAVLVAINRLPCLTKPCPAFGHAWLDDFSLRNVLTGP